MSAENTFSLRDAVPTVTASVISGVATRIPLHPIDTLKSQIQAFSNNTTMLQLARLQTLRNLYSGFGATCLVSIPGVTLYFGAYELAKKFWHKQFGVPESETSHMINFISGLCAEAVSCVIWVPGDIIKERMQIQQVKSALNFHYNGPFHVLQDAYRKQGFRGIYKGYGATLVSFGPYSAFYLMFYEMFKNSACAALNMDQNNPTLPLAFCAGGIAGATASLLTAPLDLIKIRLQMQRAAARAAMDTPTPAIPPTTTTSPHGEQVFHIRYNYRNVVDGLTTVWKEGGVRGLFRGAGARMAYSAPAAAITISLWDTIRGYVDRQLNPKPAPNINNTITQ